jgi:hypothetical protein
VLSRFCNTYVLPVDARRSRAATFFLLPTRQAYRSSRSRRAREACVRWLIGDGFVRATDSSSRQALHRDRLFIATGSFFLGQQQVFPAFLRGSIFLTLAALLPLPLLIYWPSVCGSARLTRTICRSTRYRPPRNHVSVFRGACRRLTSGLLHLPARGQQP